MSAPRPSIRLDKWLWQARFFKSRSIAAGVVTAGKVRVDSQHVSKPSRLVGPGNVLTFVQADRTRVVHILSCGDRRGPASEAQALYEDRSPEIVRRPFNPGGDRKGRPTKKDRRAMIAHRGTDAPFDLD